MVYEFTATDDTKYFFGLHLVSSDDYRYVLNAHGDVIALVSKTGSTVAKYYEYDAFGNEINPDSSDTNPYRYCGEYYDFESGTIYLRARYYSPMHGRFTQPDRHWNTGNMIYGDADNTNADAEQTANLLVPDILAIRQSSNLYVYCGNNAPNYCDISGESFAALGVLGLIVIGALTGCEPARSQEEFEKEAARNGNIIYGSETKSYGKLIGQMERRGWTMNSVESLIMSPYTTRSSINRATGNSATAYFDEYGNYVIVDDLTNEIVQVSDRNDPNWIPDSSIKDPYRPKGE